MASRKAVRGDVRAGAAAGNFGRVKFGDSTFGGIRPAACAVVGAVRLDTAPDREAAAEVVAELKDRQWKEQWHQAEKTGDGWFLEKGDWELTVLAGTVTEEEAPELAAGQGGANLLGFYGVRRNCGASGSATPAP
ncbi:hypothetical protein FE633_04340 [Streptomyces montanus]|uniref:Uncharacterized protein n=1 Tax=Streptomyces montanus TaxID=2580423 RepID=A0A5R9FZ20_9ACTN|nr:hypothetical protein [Streptomyces montanus]TLS47276.1 hypothetical protein FE633_04340 [Streptomyces montanus]